MPCESSSSSVAPPVAVMTTLPTLGLKMLLKAAFTLKEVASIFSTSQPATSVEGSQDREEFTAITISPPRRGSSVELGATISKTRPLWLTSKVLSTPPALTVTVALRAAPSLAAAVATMASALPVPVPEVLSKVIQSLSALTSQGRSVLMVILLLSPADAKALEISTTEKLPFCTTSKVSSSSPATTVTVAVRSNTLLGAAVAMMVRVRPSGSGSPLSRLKVSQPALERTSQGTLVWRVKVSGPPQAA